MSLEEELQLLLELCDLCDIKLQGMPGLSPYYSSGNILTGFELIDTGIASSMTNTSGQILFIRTDGLCSPGFQNRSGRLRIFTLNTIWSRQEALLAAIEIIKCVK